jgi:uncharacterized cupin superfamily protein
MPKIFKQEDIKYDELQSDLEPYKWYSSPRLSELVQSKDLYFNMRKLDPGKFSYPYHFHRNAEEVLLILEGSATLRTPEGLEMVKKGDILFFEMGDTSTHQLFNHTEAPCIYFDLRTNNGFDVAEFPDTNKIIMDSMMDISERGQQVDYFKGDENVEEIWRGIKNNHTNRHE